MWWGGAAGQYGPDLVQNCVPHMDARMDHKYARVPQSTGLMLIYLPKQFTFFVSHLKTLFYSFTVKLM